MYSKEKLPEFSPAVVVEPWRKALMDAAEIIRTRGHCKGKLSNRASGAVCALGALCAVGVDEGTTASHAWQKLSAHVGRDVVDWNDERDRTASEVIAAFEGAAKS